MMKLYKLYILRYFKQQKLNKKHCNETSLIKDTIKKKKSINTQKVGLKRK